MLEEPTEDIKLLDLSYSVCSCVCCVCAHAVHDDPNLTVLTCKHFLRALEAIGILAQSSAQQWMQFSQIKCHRQRQTPDCAHCLVCTTMRVCSCRERMLWTCEGVSSRPTYEWSSWASGQPEVR